MQEYTTDVNPTLTIDNLKGIGPKLKTLPEGWTFETKVLEKDLVLDTTKSHGWASIIRDDLDCTYPSARWRAVRELIVLARMSCGAMPGEGSGSGRPRRFGRGPVGETTLQRVERIGDAYGLVLVLILTTFVVTMTLPPEGWAGRVAAVAVAGLTAVIALTSSDVRPGRVRFAIGAGLVAVLAAALGKAVSSDALLGIAFVIDALLQVVAAVTILRRVVLAARVDFRTILGAISVFTLLGLLFGYVFIALGRLQGGDVFAGVDNAQARDYLFFSYTTLTTTGYGNLVPAGTIGQILAVFEMLTGQVFLVTLVAGLVSLWRPGSGAGKIGGRDEQ